MIVRSTSIAAFPSFKLLIDKYFSLQGLGLQTKFLTITAICSDGSFDGRTHLIGSI